MLRVLRLKSSCSLDLEKERKQICVKDSHRKSHFGGRVGLGFCIIIIIVIPFGGARQRAPLRNAAWRKGERCWEHLQVPKEWPADKGEKNLLPQGMRRGPHAS